MTSKLLAAVLALCSFGFAQGVAGDPGVGDSNSGSCTPVLPSMTYAYAGYAANTCTGGCTGTGNAVTTAVDLISTNNLSGTGHAPTFTASAINSLGTFTFSGSGQYFGTATDINSDNVTFVAIVNPTDRLSNYAILGHGTTGNYEWRINTSGKQELLAQGVASIATSTTTIATGSYTAIALVYGRTTGGTFYICSGGTCTADGTIPTYGTALSTTSEMDYGATSAGSANDAFKGSIAFVSPETSKDSTAITAFGTFASCKFGL